MIQELADGLKDVILETPDSALGNPPERVYTDLACRLVIRLAGKIVILPHTEVGAVEDGKADAACRILDIFTEWLRENPSSKLVAGYSGGRFEIAIDNRHVFLGESLQDAYGQAATTIGLDREGEGR